MKLLTHIAVLILLGMPLSASALFDQCKALFPDQLTPSTSQPGRDLCFDDFAIYYSPLDKKPIYTVERLNGEALQGPRPHRSNQFYEEARLPSQERSLLSDYRDSGFDRGHNVPAGDMTIERGMAQSFSMANMMPQARLNNQGIWAKRVEEATRLYAKRSGGDIYVFTGSAGSLGSIGKSKVTIPAHLYKLIYDPSKQSAWAYWVENTNEAQVSPLISYAELKSRTGIDFHLAVHDETAKPSLEASPLSRGKPKLGGWYPIFFDQFSPAKIADLNANIAAGRVASVEVQYDRNLELAQQIEGAITSTKTTPVFLTQNSPPQANEVSYERNRVIAIVRSK